MPGSTLTLWHAWQGEARAALDRWVQAYTAGVRVETTYIPLNDLGARFAAATDAGTGPDCVIGPPEWLGRWALEGLVRPLGDVLDEAARRCAHRVAWDAVTFEGAVYAVPLVCSTLALYYDRARLPAPPATFEAMLQAAAAGGLVFDRGVQWAVGYLHALDGALMDARGSPALQSAAGAAWLARLAEMYRTPGVITDPTGSAFAGGRAAMAVDGPWRLAVYRAALGDRLGVALLPALGGKPAAPWVRAENAYISRAIGGDRPAAVMRFLSHILSSAGDMPGVTGALPVSLDAVPGGDALLAGFMAQAAQGVPFPNRPELEAYWAPVQRAIDAVVVHSADPAAALDEAAAAVQAQVAGIRANLPDSVYPSFAAPATRRSMVVEGPIFPFILQGEIKFEAQTAHPQLGCAWQGVAGTMRSMDGQPMTRVIMVHVRGSGLSVFVVAGTAEDHGPGGWEVTVGSEAAPDTYHVTLMHTNGELLSETFRVRFPGSCEGNLARLDFVQVKPL
ncbi:MAG: extracellular solute-binding protein [Anaerolineae bacterium]|nr:extracellular solute-binding protein [Anaerolineae bacterium]